MEDMSDFFAKLGNPTAEQLRDMTKSRAESHLHDFATNRKEFIASAVNVMNEISNNTKRINELAIILGNLAACRFSPLKQQFDDMDNPV